MSSSQRGIRPRVELPQRPEWVQRVNEEGEYMNLAGVVSGRRAAQNLLADVAPQGVVAAPIVAHAAS